MTQDLGGPAGGENGLGERRHHESSLPGGNGALPAAPSAADGPSVPRPERRGRRAKVSAPVRVRGVDAAAHSAPHAVSRAFPHEISTTLDVSRSGLLFVSPAAAGFAPGMAVAVTFPYCKTPAATQAEKPGRVVRVSALGGGQLAVAIELLLAANADAPAAVAAAAAALKPEWNRSPAVAAEHDKPLVLLVEADAPLRGALRGTLADEGYEVIAVAGAAEAHDVLNLFVPALLISEIEGDDLPGFGLCARVKSTKHLQSVPVMLMTRSAYPSDYANAHSLGAVVCIAKPFRLERLLQMARLLVPSPRAQRMVGPQKPPPRRKTPPLAKVSRRNGHAPH